MTFKDFYDFIYLNSTLNAEDALMSARSFWNRGMTKREALEALRASKPYELMVAWASGDYAVYEYDTEGDAQLAGEGMVTALGEQIRWFGVRRKN